jgi:hypothetical protein
MTDALPPLETSAANAADSSATSRVCLKIRDIPETGNPALFAATPVQPRGKVVFEVGGVISTAAIIFKNNQEPIEGHGSRIDLPTPGPLDIKDIEGLFPFEVEFDSNEVLGGFQLGVERKNESLLKTGFTAFGEVKKGNFIPKVFLHYYISQDSSITLVVSNCTTSTTKPQKLIICDFQGNCSNPPEIPKNGSLSEEIAPPNSPNQTARVSLEKWRPSQPGGTEDVHILIEPG